MDMYIIITIYLIKILIYYLIKLIKIIKILKFKMIVTRLP